ncbi:MAG: tRNA (adenosine(37)-N6)-threonylcarbamoyltransferase complex dimerization subunit type 1 TsaB [Succinivibrio sp.]|nr:tRNA (adenosine(37)-N6)-threonylcarbamoyltransferase complex dimerization subunit type 1 TsaB [Succinivibrio sp.]
MKLLALDTATENISVAIYKDGAEFFKSNLAPQKHAEIILPMIDELLKEAEIDKKDLDGIVLCVGPGSFTGVRVATSTAQGLALALDLKIATVTSLEALALEALSDNSDAPYVVSSIDARMNELYLAVYKNENGNVKLIDSEVVLPYSECAKKLMDLGIDLDSCALAGTGIEYLKKEGLFARLEPSVLYPNARFILKEGKRKFDSDLALDPSLALPLYVRNEVTWKKVSDQ